MVATAFAIINLLLIPLTLIGVIRKVKAVMQSRAGAPVLQPFYDFLKMMRKGETISETASWIFVWSPRVGIVIALVTGICVPWTGVFLPASWSGATNFLLVIYLMALGKFLTMLAAMDTGSAFGGLGSSRDATIGLLAEPVMVIGLGALGLGAGSMDLVSIYGVPFEPIVAGLAGCGLCVAALAELSRMPVDDPTTHLELTMVHEAMLLENSGRSLALVEYAAALRTCILLGLAAQTFLHMWSGFTSNPVLLRYAIGLAAVFAMGIFLGIAEGLLVKLRWRSVPGFISFGLVFSVLAAVVAAAHGAAQ